MSLPAERIASDTEEVDSASNHLPDDHIIRRVIDGDVALFELILRRYNQRLFRVARSIIGDDGEAEDIVQEAYVRAFQNLRQFEGRSLFSTWLTKIAVYEATARRRKGRRLSLVDPSGETEIDSMVIQSNQRDASDEVSRNELKLALANAVNALPTDLRAVFTLRMVERLSTQETAECLGLTTANVKVRLHRARLELRSWIDQRIGKESRELFMFAGDRCDRIVANVMSRVLILSR
jgi:RNA polymerase sigma-70 factor (ECF subfamily)